MPEPNVFIEQKITKKIRKFIGADGQVYDGSPEQHMGHQVGRAGTPVQSSKPGWN
jgi:hypothetical protein